MANKSEPALVYQSNPLELIRTSYRNVRANGRVVLKLALVVIAAFLIIGGSAAALIILAWGSSGFQNQLAVAGFIAGFVAVVLAVTALSIAFGSAYYRVILDLARGKAIVFENVIRPDWRLGWQLFLAHLLMVLVVAGGFVLLVVPGILFLVWFSLVGFAVVEEKLGPVAALRRSRELVKNRFWDVAGAQSVSGAAAVVMIVPVLGFIVYMVVSVLVAPVTALRYQQLVALKTHSDGRGIPTSGWNFVIILLALVSSGAGSANSQPPSSYR